MSDLIRREDVLDILDEEEWRVLAIAAVLALPAVQPDAREAALREAAAMLTSGAMHGCDNPDEVLECAGAILALINTTGKEVTDPGRNAPPSDTAPAGLSAGGGAEKMADTPMITGLVTRNLTAGVEPTAAPHVNETPKSEHDAADMLTPATKGGE